MKAEPTDLQSVPFNHSGTDPNKRNYKEENEKKQDNFFFFYNKNEKIFHIKRESDVE